MSGSPDPKPRKRLKLPRPKYLEVVRELLRLHPICELCEKHRAQGAHHVVPRQQGGDDVLENLAALCGSGTTDCHGLITEEDKEARVMLRRNLRPETIEYIIGRKGLGWLNRKYPEA